MEFLIGQKEIQCVEFIKEHLQVKKDPTNTCLFLWVFPKQFWESGYGYYGDGFSITLREPNTFNTAMQNPNPAFKLDHLGVSIVMGVPQLAGWF